MKYNIDLKRKLDPLSQLTLTVNSNFAEWINKVKKLMIKYDIG